MGNRSSKRWRKGMAAGIDPSTFGNPLPKYNEVENAKQVSDWLAVFKKRLDDQHQKLTIQSLPWMNNECFTFADYPFEMHLCTNTEDLVEEKLAEFHDMFGINTEKNKGPMRILIEGPPGYSMTILKSKLCFDHANEKDYVKDFDLVLYYPLRCFKGNIEEIFLRGLRLEEKSDYVKDAILTRLKSSSTNVLVLLDGLNEVPKVFMRPLVSLFRGESFPHLSIVVTSNPNSLSRNGSNKKFDTQYDVNINWATIWQKRIKVKGLSKQSQEQFMLQCLAGVPENIKHNLVHQVKQLAKRKLLTSEVLECPLFLQLVISALADSHDNTPQNFKSRTELYKFLLNFIAVQCTTKSHKVSSTHLFSISKGRKSEYAILLSQFGQFSLDALKTGKVSFSRNDVLGRDNERDSRILELGLLTANSTPLLDEEISEEAVYEPIHNSLLEFAAAYRLWVQFLDDIRDEWMVEIQTLALNTVLGSSQIIPFLAGLLGENAGELFKALKPYSANCTVNWKGWLANCVPELPLTLPVLSSLETFLPHEWTKRHEDIILTASPQRETILRHGIKVGRIKCITWRVGDSITLPGDVAVNKAVLFATSRSPRNWIRFCCKHLVCVFSDCIFLPEFQNILLVLQTIKYESISFMLGKRLDIIPLPTICRAITTAELKDARIFAVKCILENQPNQLKALNDLVQSNKVDVVNVCIKPDMDEEFETIVSSNQVEISPEVQEQLGSLMKSAADSSQLSSLIINNDSHTHLIIDLAELCDGRKKTWECLFLNGFKIQCSREIPHSFKMKYLHVSDSEVTYSLFSFLRFCQVKSLSCSATFLFKIGHLHFAQEYLTELNISIDESVFDKGVIYLPMQFQNLQILVLTMTPLKCKPESLCLGNPLFDPGLPPKLKGIELWQINKNRELASLLAGRILEIMEESTQKHSVPLRRHFLGQGFSFFPITFATKPAQIEYLLLQNGRGYFDHSTEFLSRVKCLLKIKSLLRLDIVDDLDSFSSVEKLFSPEESFAVEHDLWGLKQDDSIQSRVKCELLNTKRLQKRCSVTLNSV